MSQLKSLVGSTYNSLLATVNNDKGLIPNALAEFVEMLINFANTDQDVPTGQIYSALRSRDFASKLLKAENGFERQTNLRVEDIIEGKDSYKFSTNLLTNGGKLESTESLIAAINFINNDSSHPWGNERSEETRKDRALYSHLGDGDIKKGRRFALISRTINNFLNFRNTNSTGRLLEPTQRIDLAKKLILHKNSEKIVTLTQDELEGLANSGGYARAGFIDWVLNVTLDAVNGDTSKAKQIGLSNYDDLLRLFNNIKGLTNV